jgi:hypothetical protein
MRRRALPCAFVMWLLAASPLAAQPDSKPAPKVENVIVTGARTRQAIEGFIQSLGVPTRAIDKVARWQQPICPVAAGLKPAFLSFITRRLKDVAAQAGAPVNAGANCEPNIAIVFTTTPQALIDNVKKKMPGLLGYYDNRDQLDRLATVTRPLQAWYTTATEDAHGQVTVDSGKMAGTGLELHLPCQELYPGIPMAGICTLHLSNAHGASTTSSHLGDGLRSGLYNVIIVANPDRLVDDEMGTMADYIAMLALAQVNVPDSCQPLSTILNLLASGCTAKSEALTDNDTGYLGALYKMSPDRTLQVQRDEMTSQMQKSLGVRD